MLAEKLLTLFLPSYLYAEPSSAHGVDVDVPLEAAETVAAAEVVADPEIAEAVLETAGAGPGTAGVVPETVEADPGIAEVVPGIVAAVPEIVVVEEEVGVVDTVEDSPLVELDAAHGLILSCQMTAK